MIPEELRVSICSCLSKSGNLGAHENLSALSATQSKTEVIEFYCFLRDHSQRWESEWRSEFAQVFSVPEHELPKIDDADRWSVILHGLVERRDLRGIRAFIEGIGVPNWDFPPRESDPEIDVYPIDDPDVSGESPTAKARRLGLADIAEYLEGAKKTVRQRYRMKWEAAYANTEQDTRP